MADAYNPIVRTFCQVRSGLLAHLDVDRRDIRPATRLDALLPVPCRRQVWRELQERGLRVPALELSRRDSQRTTLRVLQGLASAALTVQLRSALWLVVPLSAVAVASWTSRRRAVRFPLGLTTLGELVICATSFADHKESGYRWTRNEIALKVRLTIAESLGVPLEDVQPERTLEELGAL